MSSLNLCVKYLCQTLTDRGFTTEVRPKKDVVPASIIRLEDAEGNNLLCQVFHVGGQFLFEWSINVDNVRHYDPSVDYTILEMSRPNFGDELAESLSAAIDFRLHVIQNVVNSENEDIMKVFFGESTV